MSRFILTVAVLTIAALATSGTVAEAAKPPSGSGNKYISSNKGVSSSYVGKSIVGSSNHCCYRLQSYCGWSRCCWYPNYGCYGYFCPDDCQWYYYCAAQCRYLPVCNLGIYRPTTCGFGVPPTCVGGGTTILPVGATAVPTKTQITVNN